MIQVVYDAGHRCARPNGRHKPVLIGCNHQNRPREAIDHARTLEGVQGISPLRESGVDPVTRAVPHDGAAAPGSTPDPRERVTRYWTAAQ